ncbi:uncharacterized protein EI90DRAFT_2990649 [Cantharellus anzutake]|uniref:uncharacterized protein n=1 Tax=Cantharellus anzutake TaxID=1750568 RepID=UPI00190354D0|nr:uncharacterized protein EI90DRAFT_2990649 [Cantharellus anzutake]KAF8338722.1 hypothetical protein EI90DRAFT_2990649 [Cantharellus anzutake]
MSHRHSPFDQGMYGRPSSPGSTSYPSAPQGYYGDDVGISPTTQLTQPNTRQRASPNARRSQHINQGLPLPPPSNLSASASYEPLPSSSVALSVPQPSGTTPVYSREQPTRQKSKAYTTTIAAQSDDLKYQTKYKDLKRKVRDIEVENDKLHVRILKAKRNIQRMRLERAILYERLASMGETIEPPIHSSHTDSPLPPPTVSTRLPPVDVYAHSSPYREHNPSTTTIIIHNSLTYRFVHNNV